MTRSKARRAGEVAARAFQNDPMFVALIPDDATRKRSLPHLFEFAVRYAVAYGEVYATSEHMEGVAAWLPHGRVKTSLWRALRLPVIRLVSKVDHEILNRFRTVEAAVQHAHFRLASFPHWYLALIAVEPQLQREGLGSALLEPVLARLDRERKPCYLETQTERNVAMYEGYGFRTLEEFTPPGGTKTWAMLREPQESTRP